ncbi:MAG: hypothetical protein LQ339_007977 [Xanthoria mediterranea]|nr:MAG: hypothetical protein LQ339_007977 [Xanthoria mediterranea]
MTVTSLSPPWEQPSHRNLIKVHGIDGCPITNHFFVKDRTWATGEAANGMSIDLNSDLYYVNHSCAPSLEYDVKRMEGRVSRYRDLHEGDLLTFFYPSTEWHMAQPSECNCHAPGCLGTIMGASEVGKARLDGYWLNKHIQERLGTRAETVEKETL